MKIKVLTGPQGGGKSAAMRKEAIANPGLYLFALPTRDLIKEQVTDFFATAPWLETVSVYSASGKGGTARRLKEARENLERRGVKHAVVFTTHATLLDHPLDGFAGWHARIDEAPNSVKAGRMNIAVATRDWLKTSFDLVHGPDDEWAAIRFKGKAPDWKAVERDAAASALKEFIAEARRPERVFVHATSWDEKDDIGWFSLWTPLALSEFATVVVAGSAYTDSIGFKVAQDLFEKRLGIDIEEVAPGRTGQPRITISYFRDVNDGSTTFWESHDGLRVLVPVTDFLAENLSGEGFWSGNKIIETVMMGRLKGQFISPLAAGLNAYREAGECAFIYSAKPTPKDKPLMDVFHLTSADIEKAREEEAIIQFVMRGAIRNPDYGKPYGIYLYSKPRSCPRTWCSWAVAEPLAKRALSRRRSE